MVEKTVGSTYTQIVYGPQGRFATMHGQTTLVSAFIPLPGAQAVYTGASLMTSNKVAYYRHTDHLGSSRLATTPTQTLYSSTAYAPFGEPYSQAGTSDLSFTGQDQDTVSGIHDFLDRKYPTVQGRWLSPDPAGLAAVNPANPQSWNRYAYVLNNPLAMIDPFGDDGCYSMGAADCTGYYYGGGQTTNPDGTVTYWASGGPVPNTPAPGLLNNGAGASGFTTPGSPSEFDVMEAEQQAGIPYGTPLAVLAQMWGQAWSHGQDGGPIGTKSVANILALNIAMADYFPGGLGGSGLPAGPSWTGQVKQTCAQAAQAIELWITQNGTTQPIPPFLISGTLTCGQQPE